METCISILNAVLNLGFKMDKIKHIIDSNGRYQGVITVIPPVGSRLYFSQQKGAFSAVLYLRHTGGHAQPLYHAHGATLDIQLLAFGYNKPETVDWTLTKKSVFYHQ